jgi:hypothetical protein
MNGLAGFRERPVEDGDPLVCGCGLTIGTQRLVKHQDILDDTMADHMPEHKRRLAVQAASRGYARPAVPPKEDDDADS